MPSLVGSEMCIRDRDQRSLGIGPPIVIVSFDDLGQRFAAGKSTAAVGWRTRTPGGSHAWHPQASYRPNRDSATPNSLLRAVKLWYLMPTLLHSMDVRIKSRQRFTLVDGGDRVLLPMADGVSLEKGTPGKGMPPEKLQWRTSSHGRHQRVATREGPKWKHATFWRSHDQRETRRRGIQWWPRCPPRTTPPYLRPWRMLCG